MSFDLADRTRRAVQRFAQGTIALRLPVLNLCVALWLLAVLNVPFWRALWEAVGGLQSERPVFLLSLPAVALLWVWLCLELLTWGRAAKPVLMLVLLASTLAAYFMHAYGTVFDRTMIQNIIDTDTAESVELVGSRLIGWMILFGVAPLWLLWKVRLGSNPWYRQLLGKVATVGALVIGIALLVAPLFQSYAPFVRNHRELRLALVPSNYLGAAYSYVKAQIPRTGGFQRIALDARRNRDPGTKPTLAIIVIGETARAANFAFSGYARDTTPQLSANADVVFLRQVRSCGTSTAVSLPCMFLDVGQSGFTQALATQRENLLDVLHRTGYSVLWRDNNSGCKGLCDRVGYEDLSKSRVPKLCVDGECHDEVLLHGLQEKLDELTGDAAIVLHMKGSHGPAYYRRYPQTFEHFTPVCSTNQLDRCTREAIVNTYDNTLRYTDHVLARTIELLQRNAERFDAFLLYVSDHGESLGERGLFLHGVPYALAPDEQTHVPMLLWFAKGAAQRFDINVACLRQRQDAPLSHDNFYHSMLGLLDVQTSVYRPQKDLFSACRTTYE